MQTRRVAILGSTGSIGRQTLEVIAHLNGLADVGLSHVRFEVVGLSAGMNASLLAEQARRFGVSGLAIMADPCGFVELRHAFRGDDAAEQLVRSADADLVVAAMVGVAGLPATLAAIERGFDIALANKETLVAAGSIVTEAIATKSGDRRVSLFPVDSEHAGVWQCLMGICGTASASIAGLVPPLKVDGHIRRLVLTASGGPFRSWTKDAVMRATPDQALKHPTWTMGGKITIDSASLMNKCLELIEAYWLFGITPEKLDAVIHPQSIVHALVETIDGSVVAQLGVPDMRTPIQMAMLFPQRAAGTAPRLNFVEMGSLEFEPIDVDRFPAMGLWRDCIGSEFAMTTKGAVLNAANEVAVMRFLDRDRSPMAFGRISEVVTEVLSCVRARPALSLNDVLAADLEAREAARSLLK